MKQSTGGDNNGNNQLATWQKQKKLATTKTAAATLAEWIGIIGAADGDRGNCDGGSVEKLAWWPWWRFLA